MCGEGNYSLTPALDRLPHRCIHELVFKVGAEELAGAPLARSK